jgi:hypothetical protein
LGCFRGVLKVENKEALGSWFKFKEPISCMYLENTATIATVVCNVVLLSQEIKQQNVDDFILFEVHFICSKVGNSVGGHDTLVAVDIDWAIGGMDIVNMVRVRKRFTVLCLLRRRKLGLIDERASF